MIQLAHRIPQDVPHPVACAVMEVLAANGPAPGASLAAIRKAHIQSRRPFLAPLEPVHDILRILEAGRPPLIVIRPKGFQPGERRPGILYLHGGGWTLGAFETYEPFLRQLANATGSVLVWVEYRLAPEHPFPAAYDDARAALYWVHDNAGRLGIDEARLSIAGDSAGGNIAAAVSIAERNRGSAYQPWRQILLYPCLDLTRTQASHRSFADGYLFTAKMYDWYLNNYVGGAGDVQDWRLSPLYAPDLSDLPPTILLYAGFDILRDEAAAYGMKLSLSDVPLETLYFPDMIHGFLTMGGALKAANVAVERIAQVLKKFERGPEIAGEVFRPRPV